MSMISRRSLLKGALAGGALAGASSALPRIVRASGPLSATLSHGGTYNILEIFLDGGADFWAHAYDVPSWVTNATRFTPGLTTIPQSPPNDWLSIFAGVSNLAMVPWDPHDRMYFGTTGGGDDVYWGPGLKPLWPHIGRARMVAVGHGFVFHEGAAPLALTGTSLGRPIGCSLGAAVNRVRTPGDPPVSFTIVVDPRIGSNTLQASTATGFHGGGNRPVLIPVANSASAATTLYDQLDRGTPAPGSAVARADGDPLRDHHRSLYRSMLLHAGSGVRSHAYDAYDGSLSALEQYAGLRQRLAGVSFAAPSVTNVAQNPTATAIHAAVGLLGRGARHTLVVDNGWDTHDGSAYSTVEGYARYVTDKTFKVAHALAVAIADGSLDLSATLVFIHSEFGRRQTGGNGGDHSPEGYPVLLLGGPITTSGIAGHINGPAAPMGAPFSDGQYGVTAVRAAVALAAGINPWHDDMYVDSDDWLGNALHSFADLSDGNGPILEHRILGL